MIFPETYIAAFPLWSALQAPHENHDFFKRMTQESLYIDGPEIQSICDAAKEHHVLVNLGFSERAHHSAATLYNSNVLINTNGEILVHHRKLMPTFFEKLTWSPGDGYGLRVADTEFGKVGTLICGENTNPLARYAMMAQGEEVHISTWPAIWPTRVPKVAVEVNAHQCLDDGGATIAGKAEAKNYDNVAANRIRAAAHCFEAKCFGVLCASHMDAAYIEVLCSGASGAEVMREMLEASPQGASMFLDPTGTLIPGFVIDEVTHEEVEVEFLQHDAGILYADLNLNQCIEGKQYHDVTGGYQRLDVFEFKVDRTRREPATFMD